MANGNNNQTPAARGVGGAKAGDNNILQRLQERLLADTDIVTSETTGPEQLIQDSISGLQEAREDVVAGTEARFERLRGDVLDQSQQQRTELTERRRGSATSMGALKQLEKNTEESLRDLDLREQEALASGQIETASQIANLKLQQLQFRQQARQNVFNNLLQASQLEIQQEAGQREERQLVQQERQAMGQIALEFGVDLKENDDIESVIARAKPFANEQRKLQLEKIKAEIQRTKAATARALRGDDSALDEADLDSIAIQTIRGNTSFLENLSDNNAAKIATRIRKLQEPQEYSDEEIRELVRRLRATDKSLKEIEVMIASQSMIGENRPIKNVDRALEIIQEQKPKGLLSGLFGSGGAVTTGDITDEQITAFQNQSETVTGQRPTREQALRQLQSGRERASASQRRRQEREQARREQQNRREGIGDVGDVTSFFNF